MEKQHTKGRPPKSPQKTKRCHYSVWLSEEQKRIIDQQIQQSNLSASQFFLTQVLDNPVRRPKKKSLPKAVVEKIVVLEKLSGLLALAVLKTKDKDMISKEWLQSSQQVRFLTHLILCWIFEDFDLPDLRKTLMKVQAETHTLYHYLVALLPTNKTTDTILETLRVLHQQSSHTLHQFDDYYQWQEIPTDLWTSLEEPQEIHQAITILIKNFLQQKQ
jgi:hypothetical protein